VFRSAAMNQATSSDGRKDNIRLMHQPQVIGAAQVARLSDLAEN